MCGIFGYVGKRGAVPLVLGGIKRLEYRGYDSAGIAGIEAGMLVSCKEVGNIAQLARALSKKSWACRTAIAHTRWATHGGITQENAHPQFGLEGALALVHNGIIENYASLSKILQEKGIRFLSETDTEVVSQLVGDFYRGDLLRAVQEALPLLEGVFALALIHRDHPEEIVCVAQGSPLVIGRGCEENYVASDPHAFLMHTRDVVRLRNGEIAVVTPEKVSFYDTQAREIVKGSEPFAWEHAEVTKGEFAHFMHKEIHEQVETIARALQGRYDLELGTAVLEELLLTEEELLRVERIVILACGTSYHAGLTAALMIEEWARIPVQVEISSEFRYRNPIVREHTLAIAISQSGETADTLAALRELKAKGAKVVGICNVPGSTLACEVDSALFLKAGPEIGVASTKAYTSQLVTLTLLALRLGRLRSMSQQQGVETLEALLQISRHVADLLKQEGEIIAHAKKYGIFDNFFFLGRRFMYPTALEGALKLKEIAYVNANGYPAGEMKHGPISLVQPSWPTVAFCADRVTEKKMVSSLMEIKARQGKILAFVPRGCGEIEKIADDLFWLPAVPDALAPILSVVPAQLFAYHVALGRGAEIDQPRNLAKSVTVE